MKRVRALVLFLLTVTTAALAEETRKFLSVSDVHFDAFADPAIVTKLESADVSEWEAILASSTVTAFSVPGKDTNDPLLQSAMAEMQKQIPSPAFVTISGDFLAHGFNKSYQEYANDKSQAAYTAFVAKTMAYLAMQFQKRFPGARIYPTLGNNDSDCGDYAVTPNSAFLANFRDAWSPLVQSRSFDRRFGTGGYYHADVPGLKKVRIIALNSNFFSTNYDDPCGKPGGPDPGMRELEWLDAELRLARAQRQRVWLLFHIPPGMNVYNTVSESEACPTPETFWKDEYTQRYLRIANAHKSTIVGSLAGHTHQDEFRFASGDFVHITPSVTPIFGNNPAFEIVDIERDGDLVGYTAWHLPSVTLPWAREYSFGEAYGKSAYDTATLTQLASAIGSDAATRGKYFGYFSSGSAKSTAGALEKWKGYWCGFTTMTGSTFTTCYCAPP